MSRVNFDDYDEDEYSDLRAFAFGWNEKQALGGRKGQKFLREMEAALLALPRKELVANVFVAEDGGVCPLAALALKRSKDAGKTEDDALAEVRNLLSMEDAFYDNSSYENCEYAAKALKTNRYMAYAVMYCADEQARKLNLSERYDAVLAWVRKNLKEGA